MDIMSRKLRVLALVVALGACATGSGPPAVDGESAPASAESGASPAGWAVAIVGTPFALAFKTAICAASLAIAAPIAGLLVLDPDPYSEGHEILGDGIANNCGPPYVVSPHAAG
jgi:ABC-type sugar transport system substrate-binding protein